jgi:hypothetical protein
VILASQWPDDINARTGVEKTIARILSAGSQPIVILSNQEIRQAASCPIKNLMFLWQRDCSVAQSEVPRYWTYVRKEFPNTRFIDPNNVICSNGSCSPVIGRTLLYRDDGHLNEIGSRLIGRVLLESGVSLVRAGDSVTSLR